MNKYLGAGVGIFCIAILWWWFSPTDNERAISNIPPREVLDGGVSIIAFGDSLTAGYGLPASESYPAQLEETLRSAGYQVTVINAGVSGETTRGNFERAAFIRSQNPDIVIVGIGGNDALRLLPLAETEKNMRETIRTLTSGENPPVVIVLRMQAPLTAGLGYKQDFDALYETIAEDYDLVLVPFLTAELFLNPENKLEDGIHYNANGYKQVVEQYLTPVLVEILSQIEAPR